MSKIIIPHLEWHISHACNLTCESCVHFTNHNHQEIVSIEKLKEWYSLWNKRISPQNIVLLGGEPLLHKDLVDIIYLTREMWTQPPNGNYWITTNGLLLENHPRLPIALRENNCMLQISLHGGNNTKKYNERIKKIFPIVQEWDKKYNIKLIKCNSDIEFQNLCPNDSETYVTYRDMSKDWSRSYKGYGINSEPFEDNDLEQSWSNCVAGQKCFQLHQGNIYKCCMTAYLQLQKDKYGDLLSKKWDPYLKYIPLYPDCTDKEIIEFFNRKAEPVCGMCPKNPQSFSKKDPLTPVSFYDKKNNFKHLYS